MNPSAKKGATTSNKMRVVFVHPAIRPYRKDFFEAVASGFDCRFIFVEDYQDNLSYLPLTKITNYKVYRPKYCPFYSKGFTPRLIIDALFGDYDVWISSGLFHVSTHLVFAFVKLRRKKLFLFSEDWWFGSNLRHRLFKKVAKYIARHCDTIIAASTASRDFFTDLSVPPEKIFVATNSTSDYGNISVDSDKLFKLKQKLGIENTDKIILYSGRIVKYKGLDVLIQAFSKLNKLQKNSNIKLIVLGSGDFLSHCVRLVEELALKNVIFIPAVNSEEVKNYYELARVVVAPGRFLPNSQVFAEAWGFVANEALSCGVPVISTEAVAAARDLIKNGINGFVVKSEDADELAEKIELLLTDDGLYSLMSSNARKTSEQYTPQKQFESVKEALMKAFDI